MDVAPQSKVVQSARGVAGALRMPGDKSISHRYAMLAAIANGTSRITNYAPGEDCARTLDCVRALGASVTRDDSGVLAIAGSGRFIQPQRPLDCGNSGSTMRMLSGLLAGQDGIFTLTGDASLNRRPMTRIAEPLTRMGARVETADGHAPITIHGNGRLNAITWPQSVPSAQVKTALLFAGMQTHGLTTVEEQVRTRDHGELALRAFGMEVSRTMTTVSVVGLQMPVAADLHVPGDISSAAFFLCAALLFPGSSLTLDGIGMNPTRSAILDVLVQVGLRVRVLAVEERHGELFGTLHVEGPPQPLGAEVRGALTAQLIDELPVLAAIAPYTRDGVRIRDAAELRNKESDRLSLIARNLRAMGAECDEFSDGLDIPGGQQLHGAEIETAGDHRIAMAFSIAALRAQGETLIQQADCVSVSFPEFFAALDYVAQR